MTGDDFIKFSSFNPCISLGSVLLLYVCTQARARAHFQSVLSLLLSWISVMARSFLCAFAGRVWCVRGRAAESKNIYYVNELHNNGNATSVLADNVSRRHLIEWQTVNLLHS